MNQLDPVGSSKCSQLSAHFHESWVELDRLEGCELPRVLPDMARGQMLGRAGKKTSELPGKSAVAGHDSKKIPSSALPGQALRIVSPPSTGITAPVRYEAAGRHKLKVICATSSG